MKYVYIYNLLVISLIAYFVGSALFSLQKARSEPISTAPPSEPEKTTSKAVAPVPPLEHYKVIVERNLFGGIPGKETVEPEEFSPEDVPLAQRSVGLKLVGTVVTDEPPKNVAIIENQRNHEQEAYHEGDEVEQIQIKRILRNNVIISMGAEEQRLTMDLEEDPSNSPRSASSQSAAHKQLTAPSRRSRSSTWASRMRRSVRTTSSVSDSGAGQSEQPESKASPPDIQGDQPESETGATRLQQQEIDSALVDTDKAREEMHIKPYPEGGESGGFQIGSVKSGSIFAKMGLRPGDVVTGLNEEAVTGVEQAEDLYDSLLKGDNIYLEVKRGGRTQKLQVTVE